MDQIRFYSGEGNKCGKNETCSVCEPCYPSPSCEQPSGGVCTEECRRVGSQHFCSCAPEYVTGPEGNCILENDCPNKTGSPTSTTIPPTCCFLSNLYFFAFFTKFSHKLNE